MTTRAGRLLRGAARGAFGEYEPYLILRLDAPPAQDRARDPADGVHFGAESDECIGRYPAPDVRAQASYGGEGALLFVAREGERILGTLWCWYGERYARRGFIALGDEEVKIVHVYTTPASRGRGIGSRLLRHASAELLSGQFRAVLARVWITNRASVRMFVGAGFRPTHLVLVIRPWPLRRPLRFEARSPWLLSRLSAPGATRSR